MSRATAGAELSQHLASRNDSVLNGALIGAGVAIAGALFLCTRTEPWENCRDDWGPMLKVGAIGAGVGIAIDALIRKPAPSVNTPLPRVQAMPVIGRRGGALQLSVSF